MTAENSKIRGRRVKIWLFIFTCSFLILLGGGRIVSSDEISMYRTVENIVRHGQLDIPVDQATNSTMIQGKAYTWYEAGNILIGIPFYLAGLFLSFIIPLPENLKMLLSRIFVSTANAFIGGGIAVIFFSVCRTIGLSHRKSLSVTFVLIFSTFLLPYFKLYLREPVLALCLISAFYFLLNNKRSFLTAGAFIGFGILTKFVFIINLLPFFIYILTDDKASGQRLLRQKLSDILTFLLPVILIGFVCSGIYNFLRTGSPFVTGYSGGTAFSTPLYVGLYGLLFSPGKGLLWFAPVSIMLLWAFKYYWQRNHKEAVCILGIFLLNLTIYSLYISWGGDGSWGPRYLAPIIPLLLVPIAYYMKEITPRIRKVISVLAIVGFLIQVGGISIYAGAYIREIGEYPYSKNFDDPEFLYKTHFIPNYSPIIGHWRILIRNIVEHFEGNYPRLQLTNIDRRIPLGDGEENRLLHTIDYWFAYAIYFGISWEITLLLFAGLAAASSTAYYFLRRSIKILQY